MHIMVTYDMFPLFAFTYIIIYEISIILLHRDGVSTLRQ